MYQNFLKTLYELCETHKVSETTITNDSNLIQVPTHNITHDETNNQNQDNTLNTTQDNISVLSTSQTNVTQPSQTQTSPRQNYYPPSIPPQFSTQINSQISPQQGASSTQHTNTVHFQTPTPPSPPELQTSTYTPAQNNSVQNVQTGLNINTIHSNPPFNYTTSRHLSRPPLQPILTYPLSYNLTITNSSHTQQSQTNNNRPNSLNTFPPHKRLIQSHLHYKTHNSKYKIPFQQLLELIPTFITHLLLLLPILQMFLHTIQYHHLSYLTIPFHTQPISILLLQYQNLLNLSMV